MAWIESHQTLLNHPKLAAVCQTLGAERPTMIGHLHILWWWCIDYALDGELRYSNAQIAAGAGWTQDADKFVDALVIGGFIDRDEDGMRIHDWEDFCGSLIDKRLERQEKRNRGSRTAAKRRTMEAERRKVADENSRLASNPTNPTLPTVPYPTLPTITVRPQDVVDEWNAFAEQHGLSKIAALTDKRTSAIRTRLSEKAFDLPTIYAKLARSDFAMGVSGRWKVNFDFVFCSPNNYVKILEGNYDNREGVGQVNQAGSRQRHTITRAELDASILPPTGT